MDRLTPDDLRAARKALGGLSQRQLAEAMGVTKYAVQHWEHGVNPVPAWAAKLLEALIWLKVTESKLAELGVTPPRLEA